MALKLDDLISKKKEPAQVLDLSHVQINSKEDLKKYMERVPEYKVKADNKDYTSLRLREKDWSVEPGRKETGASSHPAHHQYLDPMPADMRGVELSQLCPVTIDWKMLTTLRPKTKIEEELFSRMVQLGKLDLKYQLNLKKAKDSDWVRRTKNPRSSIVEMRVLSCPQCTDDFCDGSVCSKLVYENFTRPVANVVTGVVAAVSGLGEEAAGAAGGDQFDEPIRRKRRRRRRRKRRTHSSSVALRKNSIFNRQPSRGCTRDHSRREKNAVAFAGRRSVSHDRAPHVPKRPRSNPRSKSAPRIHFNESVNRESDESDVERKFIRQCTLNYSDSDGDVWYPVGHKKSDGSGTCSADSWPEEPGQSQSHRTLQPATVSLEFPGATNNNHDHHHHHPQQRQRRHSRRRNRPTPHFVSADPAWSLGPSVTKLV